MPSVCRLAHRERLEFAELLEGLTAEQWAAPSLCTGWSVRDVAAHTVGYLDQTVPRLAARMVAARGDVDRVNAAIQPTFAAAAPARLVELMHRGAAPSGAGGLYNGRVALIECLIHQQDIRRPLGLPRTVAPEALRVALSYARISPVIATRRVRGLHLVATDLDWSAGQGPEVRGPGEALLLAMTGRGAAVRDELSGPGLPSVR
ncbi:maleylpyruvate isomerase family mycothiol-dependent enzyme [Mycolicibacterium vaccae]|uniref:maleylpyruvate isomerase family mycothiol-dependent enzyme n=1 Tax=Mycolicibacterium vaccae TaxID=1810 RepID=UPI003CEB00EB